MRLYKIWKQIKFVCDTPANLPHEEDNLITYCHEWNNFDNFYNWSIANGYSDKAMIYKTDVVGDYKPENCCWIVDKGIKSSKKVRK